MLKYLIYSCISCWHIAGIQGFDPNSNNVPNYNCNEKIGNQVEGPSSPNKKDCTDVYKNDQAAQSKKICGIACGNDLASNEVSDGTTGESKELQKLNRLRDLIGSIKATFTLPKDACSCSLSVDVKVSSVKDFKSYRFAVSGFGAAIPKNILEYTNATNGTKIKVSTLIFGTVPEMQRLTSKGDNVHAKFVALEFNQKLMTPLAKEHNIKIVFPREKVNRTNYTEDCSYWEGPYSSGYWSTRGCHRDDAASNATHIVCSCNHLTDFSVLMRVKEVPYAKVHRQALHWITAIGCSISVVFLFTTIIIILSIRKLSKDNRFKIHAGLSISLLAANILLLTTDHAIQYKDLCFAYALLLYYLLLSAFCWMLCEGIYIWRGLLQVFSESHKFRYLLLLGQGFPLLMVTITASIFQDNFYNEENCWLSWKQYASWAFTVPVLFICLANFLILLKSVALMWQKREKEKFRRKNTVRFAIILLPILGCTWVLGIFAFSEKTIVFQYIFTVLNSLQGFFIFCFYIAWSKTVRREIGRRIYLHRDQSTLARNKRISMKRSQEKCMSSSCL